MKCEYEIRPLDEGDIEQVQELDLLSDNAVATMLDSDEYAYGVFIVNELIAYCTIGGADGCDTPLIENHPSFRSDSLLLSDVFVHPNHRSQGVADLLIDDVLQNKSPFGDPSVFLQLLDDDLAYLYRHHGFDWCDDSKTYCMVRDPWTIET